jgi:protein kinase domain-containing protein
MFLGLMIFYMATACIVACALLWTTVTQYKVENISDTAEQQYLVPICGIKKDFYSDPYMNCDLLDHLSYEKFVANGWTKIVYSAKLNNQPIAIKTVNLKGKDLTDCAKTNSILLCHNKAVEKLVREINLLKELKHETIIQLKHYCSKTSDDNLCMKYAVIATEIGDPLTNLKLLQMTWNQRRKIIQDLANLVHYAEHSPVGVLGLPDLRRPQFVLVNGNMKLTDLDDIIVGEPVCITNADCSSTLFI